MKFIVFVVALLLSGNAFASDENFYTRFDMAYSIGVEDGVKDGFSWQTGFGWKWFDAIRTEMTFDYMRNDLGDSLRGEALHGRISSKAVFVNAAWDVFSVRGITPYVMAGIGVSKKKIQKTRVGTVVVPKKRRTAYPWQTGGGIGFSLPKGLTLDIGYVYTNLGRFDWGDLPDKDVRLQRFSVGLRYDF